MTIFHMSGMLPGQTWRQEAANRSAMAPKGALTHPLIVKEIREVREVYHLLVGPSKVKWGSPALEKALQALAPKLESRTLARMLRSQTDPQLAWNLFNWADSLTYFTHDDHSLDALVEALGRTNDFQSLWRVIEYMRITGRRMKPMPFTFLISSYGKAGMIKEAENIFFSMVEFQCKPNVYTYNALLHVLLKQGKPDKALFIYTNMQHNGCKADTVTFNTLISGLCSNGLVEKAAMLLHDMSKREKLPDIRIYNTLISSFLKLDDLGKAMGVYKYILMKKCSPNSATYTMLLHWLCKKGKLDKAIMLFQEMINCGCEPDIVTYTVLLHALLNAGSVDVAFDLFKSLVDEKLANVDIFNVMIDWQCRNKNIDEALQLMQDMEERSFLPDTVTYNTLISGLFKAGSSSRAMSLASVMFEKGCKPDKVTYSIVVKILCRMGSLDEALALLQEMADRGSDLDAIFYNPIIDSLFRVGRDEVAFVIAQAMMQNGVVPNEMTRHLLKSRLCNLQSMEAMKLQNEIIKRGLDSYLLHQCPLSI